MTVQTWPGPRKPWTRLPGDCRTAAMAGGTRTCETSMEKFVDAERRRAGVTAMRVGRGRRLEADGEEDDLPLRVLLRRGGRRRAASRRSARRRPATSAGAGPSCDPGTRSMSPKEVKITSGRLAMAWALSIMLERGHAHRTAGPVHELDLRRQHPVDAVLDDGVGLAAADLHEHPRPRRHRAADLGSDLGRDAGRPDTRPGTSRRALRAPRARRADPAPRGSDRSAPPRPRRSALRAKPTWTST